MRRGKSILVLTIIGAFMSIDQAAATSIINPSFEDGYPQWDPPGWMSNHTGNSAGYGDHLGKRITANWYFPYWSSDGVYLLKMWTGNNLTTTSGDYMSVYQPIDLTGITEIVFDAKLTPSSEGVWSDSVEAQFLVDGMPLWTANLVGTYLNRSVDVTGFSGIKNVDLRLVVTKSGNFNSQWILWDNLRAIPEPSTVLLLGLGGLLLRRKRH